MRSAGVEQISSVYAETSSGVEPRYYSAYALSASPAELRAAVPEHPGSSVQLLKACGVQIPEFLAPPGGVALAE